MAEHELAPDHPDDPDDLAGSAGPDQRGGAQRPAPPLTWRDLVDRVVPPDATARLRAAGAVALLGLAGVALWWALRAPGHPPPERSLPFAAATATSAAAGAATTATTAGPVVAHAAGAVVAPGLHRLAPGSRVADLLAAAGGSTPDADLDRVNLAAPVADGERVWFPRAGEEAPPPVAGSSPAGGAGGRGPGDARPLDLNRATAAELEALPGVGPSIAAAIVEHRERDGPFRSVDDLLDVPGIGPARLEELRPHVTV